MRVPLTTARGNALTEPRPEKYCLCSRNILVAIRLAKRLGPDSSSHPINEICDRYSDRAGGNTGFRDTVGPFYGTLVGRVTACSRRAKGRSCQSCNARPGAMGVHTDVSRKRRRPAVSTDCDPVAGPCLDYP